MVIFPRCNSVVGLALWAFAGLSCAAFAAEPSAMAETTAAASPAQAAAPAPGAGALETEFAAPAAPAAPVTPARTPLPAALRGSRVLDATALAGRRGGAATASEMQLSGVVSDNRVSDASTGSNLVTQGAFAGAAGLPVVIQNSGNNVLIQNATIVNLQLR